MPQGSTDTLTNILSRLARKDARMSVEKILQKIHPSELAEIIPRLNAHDRKFLIDLLFQQRKAGATILQLPDGLIPGVLDLVETQKLVEICRRLPADEAKDLLRYLSPERADEIMNGLRPDESLTLEGLLAYRRDSAGGIMSPHFLALPDTTAAREAMEAIRKAPKAESVFYIYVVDEHHHLLGVVSLRQLILADPDRKLKDLMVTDLIKVRAGDDQEEVARKVARYDLLSIPVVDDQNKLIGIVTVDDVIDVIHEEATEDMYRMAGLAADERVFTPPVESARRRFPWLAINLGTAILASMVVALFQNTIQAAVILAVFMPIVAGMGGNAATQTLAVIVRGIALGELTFENARQALFKEIIAGVMNGVATGVLGAAVAYLWHGSLVIGLILAAAMVFNLFVAGVVGTLIPLFLRWLRIDPAVSSTVIITTFTDVCGFVSFLGLATLFSGRLG